MLLRSTIRCHLMTSPSANRVSSTASVGEPTLQSGAHPSTILIDVTIAAHNSRAAGRASLPGCAAEARYAAKAASYARDYRTTGPLPQVPPPSSPARLLFPRFYALNPTPARPLPDVAQ